MDSKAANSPIALIIMGSGNSRLIKILKASRYNFIALIRALNPRYFFLFFLADFGVVFSNPKTMMFKYFMLTSIRDQKQNNFPLAHKINVLG